MPRSSRPLRNGWFLAHAIVVGVLVLLFGLAVLGSDGTANIGAGIVLLPILALGLPWTLPIWLDTSWVDPLPGPVWTLVNLGPAILNVLLHAAWRLRRHRVARTE